MAIALKGEATFLTDASEVVVDCNVEMEKMLGRSREEILGHQYGEVVGGREEKVRWEASEQLLLEVIGTDSEVKTKQPIFMRHVPVLNKEQNLLHIMRVERRKWNRNIPGEYFG